jgi:hypothetical protein
MPILMRILGVTLTLQTFAPNLLTLQAFTPHLPLLLFLPLPRTVLQTFFLFLLQIVFLEILVRVFLRI